METRVFKYPNATVRVHSPNISEEENKIRMERIKQSAERLLREVIKSEEAEKLEQKSTGG